MIVPRFALAGALLASLLPATLGHAQEPTPEADSADVESVDAIVTAVYDAISGPAGPRDWGGFRSLFAPRATLAPAAPNRAGEAPVRVLTVEDYIGLAGPQFEPRPFYETESGRTTERFGNVASVMSGYESRTDPGDEEPFQRGVNAFTRLRDGDRWYVLSIAWDVDRPGNPIPDAYR